MSYFELSKKISKGGKRRIKMSLLEIHTDTSATNENGIHWKEEYITDNLESAAGMPICCEFADETKTVPLGHGFTEIDSAENEPFFKNSEVVGSIEKAFPQMIVIDGEEKRVLVGEGWLYWQRYPNFVKWLENSLADGKVMSSVEIVGKPENGNNIIYEEKETKQDFRTPKEFMFSGTAILTEEAADKSAVILQMNSINNKRKENKMDEKTIALIADAVKNAVTETNSKNTEYEQKITELNAEISEKANEINTLNTETERIRQALADLEAERQTWWIEKETLERMLGEAKAKSRIAELNEALKDFTDEQKEYAKAEIEQFKTAPEKTEINSVIAKIHEEIGKKAVADSKKNTAKGSEINSLSGDIYGDIFGAESLMPENIDIYGSVSIFD